MLTSTTKGFKGLEFIVCIIGSRTTIFMDFIQFSCFSYGAFPTLLVLAAHLFFLYLLSVALSF